MLLLVEHCGALVDRLIEKLDGSFSLSNARTWLHDSGLVEYCGDGWRLFYSSPVIENAEVSVHIVTISAVGESLLDELTSGIHTGNDIVVVARQFLFFKICREIS